MTVSHGWIKEGLASLAGAADGNEAKRIQASPTRGDVLHTHQAKLSRPLPAVGGPARPFGHHHCAGEVRVPVNCFPHAPWGRATRC